MSNTFAIKISQERFTLTSPRAPEPEFFKLEPVVALDDERPFRDSDAALLLKAHWAFKGGLQARVLGVLEIQVLMRNTREAVKRDESLNGAITSYFLRELSKLRYSGGPFPIEEVTINGRRWVKYQVPLLGTREYSTRLSPDRYLAVQFSAIDNTGEQNPRWLSEANDLLNQLMESAKLERA